MINREKHYIRIDSHHNLLDLKLREVWRYRDLIWLFTKRSFQLSYKVDIVAFVTDAYGEDHFLDGVYPGFYMEISEKINEANPFVWYRERWGALRLQEFEIE